VKGTRIPSCPGRDTLAFLRDPAAFTAGPGLDIGDVYRVRIPGYRLHVVTEPTVMERILVRDADAFVKSRIYWRELRRTMGDSMGSMDGPRWKYLHGVQRPYFTPRAVSRYLPEIDLHVARHVEELARRIESRTDHSADQTRTTREQRPDPQGPAPYDVLSALSELNARIVLSTLFGQDDRPIPHGIAERISDGNQIIAWRSKYPWRPLLARVNGVDRRSDALRAFFSEYVDDLRPQSKPDHLLGALESISADVDAPEFSSSLLRNEVMFHLGASTETQAAAEGWALYLLARHPDVLAEVRGEVDAAGQGDRISHRHLPRLAYTRQVVQETLRLYPPVYGVVRDCTSSVDLGPMTARPGETFLVSLYGLHRSPRVWNEPDAFRPERFSKERAGSIPKYHYVPFGAGRHVCIGQHLAVPAMTLTIAQLAQRFDWSFGEEPVRAEARPSLKPAGPFQADLRPRS
jgi:cytochrome P450